MLRVACGCGSAGTVMPLCAIACARRWAKSRSIDYKNDPFGEKAAWEDPAMYGAFKKFDEGAFATAAASQELAGKHFGPDWARYSTIGKFAAGALQSADAPVLSNEDLHERELLRKAKSMESNYETYEAFLAAEQRRKEDTDASGQNDETMSPQRLEEEVLSADRDVTGYRMLQTDRASAQERDDVLTSADEDDGLDSANVPLPSFVTTVVSREAPIPSAAVPAEPELASIRPDEAAAHFDISPADPLQWNTEEIIAWLKRVTPDAESVMDESMCSAFRMVNVSGDMLLSRVNPNTLFKHMRRWHLKRKAAASTREVEATLDGLRSEGVIDLQLVQETIYLCFPYCR